MSVDGSYTSRILVVDDECTVRDVVSRWLTVLGYESDAVGSAEAAMLRLEHDRYALVLTDINMPGGNGLELLDRIRAMHPDVAVVMITAIDDRATAIRTLEMGAFGYVIKPFDRNELAINVANALERRRLVMASQMTQQQLRDQVCRQTSDIRRREHEICLRLVAASEWRDNETGAHIRRIGLYSAALARRLGWDERAIEDIRFAATMHDVGKIGVPDSILLKPGKLTAAEYELIKVHTDIGFRILSGTDIPLLQMAAEIALSHHEQWNGSGYPRGLAGEAIPQTGRIVAVADVYDALVHARPYKRSMSEQETLEIMKRESATHFDPSVFECFLDTLNAFREIRLQVSENVSESELSKSRPLSRTLVQS